jgi:hypothetical protein
LTSTQRLSLKTILDRIGLEGWQRGLQEATDAKFLRNPDGRMRRWFCFPWLIDEDHFASLLGGRYAERYRDDKPSLTGNLEALAEFGRTGSG